MKVLIFGAYGMLGHHIASEISKSHETVATVRKFREEHQKFFDTIDVSIEDEIDVRDIQSVRRILIHNRPQVVINAVGLTKQLITNDNFSDAIHLNSLFPHQLANICDEIGSRLILFSTDCVFSGVRGSYTENDYLDADDLYGRTKILGEIATSDHVVTLRKSTVGIELSGSHGLVEWFLSQTGEINGFSNALYSGLTSQELSRVISNKIIGHTELSGLWHIAASPISKYDLLVKLLEFLDWKDITVNKDETVRIDRTLDSTKFNSITGYEPPCWDYMLKELAQHINKREEQLKVT